MLSGLVSASEVSFFSLPAGAKEKFSKSRIKAHKLVAKLYEHPQKIAYHNFDLKQFYKCWNRLTFDTFRLAIE